MLRFETVDVAFLKSPLGFKDTVPSNEPKVPSPSDINQIQRTEKSDQTLTRFNINVQASNHM